MLSRSEDWVWDSWYVVDGDTLHAFTLTAPRSLEDPELRHFAARVGHSISTDGLVWTHLDDALYPSSEDGFDSQATWTGSVIKDGDVWHMFYTGIGKRDREKRQSIGHATSPDLVTWTKVGVDPIAHASTDYAQFGNKFDGSEHFRDPWVFRHDNMWHMLVTASDADGHGTIGHAISADLFSWEVMPPLVRESGIRQLEVVEPICVEGKWFVLFCAARDDILRTDIQSGWGTYCAPADGPLGPYHLNKATLFAPNVYAARAVFFQGEWVLFGFLSDGTPSGFSGSISDAIGIRLNEQGTLELRNPPEPGS